MRPREYANVGRGTGGGGVGVCLCLEGERVMLRIDRNERSTCDSRAAVIAFLRNPQSHIPPSSVLRH